MGFFIFLAARTDSFRSIQRYLRLLYCCGAMRTQFQLPWRTMRLRQAFHYAEARV